MSVLDKEKQDKIEATEEMVEETPDTSEEMTDLEKELFGDLGGPDEPINLTATLHFEFSDILNAIEHLDEVAAVEPEEEPEPETEPETEPEKEDEPEVEPEADEPEVEAGEEAEEEPEQEPEEESAIEDEAEPAPVEEQVESEEEPEEHVENAETEPADEPEPEEVIPVKEKPHENILARLRGQDQKTKKLVLTDCILLAVIILSLVGGLIAANSLVKKANVANEAKIEELKANVKEVDLADSLYDMAADQVIENNAVPTYTLDQLYALDLRKPTGFTAEDLKLITRKGLVGCEEAFVKAEQTYGVNSIFLMSIASLESAYGTQMFRPNNMFGYGRSGFSSKQEGIMTVAKGLGTRYLPPGGSLYGGSPTLKGVNKRYAANPQWYYKVGKYMQGYYAQLAAEKNGAFDKFE